MFKFFLIGLNYILYTYFFNTHWCSEPQIIYTGYLYVYLDYLIILSGYQNQTKLNGTLKTV